MRDLQNLALNRPATQSSISPWSVGRTPEEDAGLAVSGNLASPAFFHTDKEDRPWWEVDLGGACEIHSVVVENRDTQQERCANFTVLVSDDRQRWTAVFRKADPRRFSTLEAPLVPAVSARYVRIRLDAEEHLHLRQVQVLGHPAPFPQAPAPRLSGTHGAALFSLLYNEDPAFLGPLLDNYLAFTDEDVQFVVNVPASYPELPSGLPASGRVHFLRAPNDRRAFGHTLLLGHLQSLRFARAAVGDFAWFAPIASNCMFVRRFEVARAVARLEAGGAEWHVPPVRPERRDGRLRAPDEGWYYARLDQAQPLLEFIVEELGAPELRPMQIEGLFAPTAQWEALARHEARIEEVGRTISAEHGFPLEELLPGTFFHRFFPGRFASVCQVLWHPPRTRVPMPQVLKPEWWFAPDIAIAKWFDRNAALPETAALASARGRALLSVVSRQVDVADLDDLLVYSDLLESVAHAIRTLAWDRRPYRSLA